LVTITSTDNPRVKAIAKLKSARERRRTGLFLIEGHRELQRAASAGIAIETLVVCDDLLGDDITPDVGAEVLHVAAAPMRRIAMRENPPGVIGIAKQFETTLSHLVLPANPLLLVADSIEKPGNLGAMMRTCDAVGAALVVADSATDLFNPNVVRASQGALFTVPVAAGAAAHVIDWLGANEVNVIGGYPKATQDMWEVDMSGTTAILVGAEDVGVSALWDDIAIPVRIPMAGSADSLNVSVSAAVLLYEAIRQRRD
jgi:RNA methyltransferase, TrmH family